MSLRVSLLLAKISSRDAEEDDLFGNGCFGKYPVEGKMGRKKQEASIFYGGRASSFQENLSIKEQMKALSKFAKEQHCMIVGTYLDRPKRESRAKRGR